MYTVGMETNSEQWRMRLFKLKHYVDSNHVAWGLNYSLASLFEQWRGQCHKESNFRFQVEMAYFMAFYKLVRKGKTTWSEVRKSKKAQSNNSERGSVLKMIAQDEERIFASGIAWLKGF